MSEIYVNVDKYTSVTLIIVSFLVLPFLVDCPYHQLILIKL